MPRPETGERRCGMRSRRGLTLIELLVVIAILSILATAAMPLSRMTVQRTRELELRQALRTIRTAIDAFHEDCLAKLISSDHCSSEEDNYPESLELLIEPVRLSASPEKTKKYLRRIPRDPMTPLDSPDNLNNWGLRSYKDTPDSSEWGGGNVFDVYSKSEAVGIDGSQYNTW